MALFNWQGLQDGQPASGQVEAASKDAANAQLQADGVTPLALTEEASSGTSSSTPAAKKQRSSRKAMEMTDDEAKRLKKIKNIKVKPKELLLFTRKFATMVKSGLPIIKTLTMLYEQVEHPGFKLIVKQLVASVQGGSTLSQAFAEHNHIFDTVYINLLKAGESSGKLTTFLDKLVVQIEKAERIRSKFKKALTYPVILLLVAIGVIIVMMVKVVPVFQGMFAASGGSLPGPTQIVVDISEFVRDPAKGGTLFFIIVGSFIALKFFIRTQPIIKQKFDVFMLKVPIIGNVIKMSTFAKVAMVQGNLNAAGVPVLESLNITKATMTNSLFVDAFTMIHQGINEGTPLSTLYERSGMFPCTFYQMLEVGEETGNMDEMFEAVTMFYEEEFDLVVDAMTEMLEPIMIVFMGLTIGFIIIAMYMPIFSMGTAV